jgi:POT family proton-dependent oligopeptide transporter
MMSSRAPTDARVATASTPLLSARSDGTSVSPLITSDHDNLRKVSDSFPISIWFIATIELCERFAYFGIVGPMQNYIQIPRSDPLRPGGIGT